MITSATGRTALEGLSRNALEQAAENLRQALRVLELVPETSSDVCPHPLIVVRAEIENARRYLTLAGTA